MTLSSRIIKSSPSPGDFLSQHLPGFLSTSTRKHVIELTWMSPPKIVYSSAVRTKHIETVAWSYPQHYSRLHPPLDFIVILSLPSSAWRITAPGNPFWWLQIRFKVRFSHHPYVVYHGFISLLLELEYAEQHVARRGGQGCVRGGISHTPSSTVPILQHAEREKRCGGPDTDFTCQSQD